MKKLKLIMFSAVTPLLMALPAAGATPDGQTAPEAFTPAPCETGIFRKDPTAFVSITQAHQGFGYTFSDGTVGNTQDAAALVACGKEAVLVRATQSWPKVAIAQSDTRFASHGAMLAGRLLQPPGAGKNTPLVVYAHGSESSGWIDRARDPYQLLGRGVSVFVYDKRGTGLSGGDYTQNFFRLADDLVAAAQEAKRLAQGRYGRFGLLGVSQGGWIAPLAATRAQADFIGIGYGLAVDITEQDAAQVAKELRDKGYGGDVIAQAQAITGITARIVKSGYKDGLDELTNAQKQFGKEAWFSQIKGGYTGVLLGMSMDDLRKNGIPQFDKLDIDWSIEPMQVLRRVTAPQLWAFAAEDRQAPIAQTLERLSTLRTQGQDIAIYLFPKSGHGMRNYIEAPDGSRKPTTVSPGFYDLMADWAKGKAGGTYGEAYRR